MTGNFGIPSYRAHAPFLTRGLSSNSIPGKINPLFDLAHPCYASVRLNGGIMLQLSRKVLLAWCIWSVLPACFAGDLKTFPAKGVDFGAYKTYQWAAPRFLSKTGVVEKDPVVEPQIKQAVDAELAKKGLTPVTDGGDLEVLTMALTDAVPQVEAAYYAGGLNMAFDTPIATMGRYNRQGTLVVNLVDTRTKKSAWVGIATESLVAAGQEKNKSKIRKAAERMFKKYPK
jgi:hypothetical protein